MTFTIPEDAVLGNTISIHLTPNSGDVALYYSKKHEILELEGVAFIVNPTQYRQDIRLKMSHWEEKEPIIEELKKLFNH